LIQTPEEHPSGAKQAAEKLAVLKGHGFSRAVNAAETTGLFP
jgi:hypothetical protein